MRTLEFRPIPLPLSPSLPLSRQLESQGLLEATFVPVDPSTGAVTAASVLAAVRPDTALVSVMMANNETGVVNPVHEIGELIRERNLKGESGGEGSRHRYSRGKRILGERGNSILWSCKDSSAHGPPNVNSTENIYWSRSLKESVCNLIR